MPKISWDRFSREIESLYTPPLRAIATLRAVRQVLRELGEGGVKSTGDLTEPAVAHWVLAHPDRSPARTESLLRTLGPISRRCFKWGHCRYDPLADSPPRTWLRPDARGPRPRKQRHRSVEDIGRLLRLLDEETGSGGWAEGRTQALVYTYAFTGVRKTEALTLEIADIDLAARLLWIHPKSGWRPKTVASSGALAIAEPLADVLARWMPRTGCEWLFPGRRLLGPWLHGFQGTKPLDVVKAAGRRAGIEDLTILDFRKSIGTNAKRWGITQLERKSLLRHTSAETGEWYEEDDRDLSRRIVGKIHYS